MGSRHPHLPACVEGACLFKDMDPEQAERFLHHARVRSLARGEPLYRPGQGSEGLQLVDEGRIKLYIRTSQGQEKVIDVIGAGACLPEATAFGEGPHAMNATALTPVRVIDIPKDMVLSEMARDTALAQRLLGCMARRVNALVRDIGAVALSSGPRRVVDYLLEASVSGSASCSASGGRTVSLPASKMTIASLLSVTPEHFSRILRELQEGGLIAVDRREIRILDAEGLAHVA